MVTANTYYHSFNRVGTPILVSRHQLSGPATVNDISLLF